MKSDKVTIRLRDWTKGITEGEDKPIETIEISTISSLKLQVDVDDKRLVLFML